MGVNLSDIIPTSAGELDDLAGKKIAIDAYNTIYQFLSVIRRRDGTPLKNSKGEITSHLSGLLYRNANLIEKGIQPIYVFDGIPSEMKEETIVERNRRRAKAREEWEDAKEEGDLERAFTKATQSSRITNQIVSTSRILLTHLGIPVIQAPEEGEAQAAYMSSKGDVWAASSQDFDALLFGASRLVRNLTMTGKRKMPGRNKYRTVQLEIVKLSEVLEELSLSREQLIDMSILMGTDYNDGIYGIGPKKGLQLVKEHGTIEEVLEVIDEEIEGYQEIRDIFLNFEKIDQYDLQWRFPEREEVIDFLCGQHDFSESRVRSTLDKIVKELDRREEESSQSSLDHF